MCAVSPTLGQKESSVRASSLLIVVANVNIGRWHSLGARRATRGGWRVSPNARPRSSPRSVETSWCPSGSPCASRPSSGARVDPRPVVSRVSLPTFHPSRLTPRPLALPPLRIGWLFKFFGLVGFATFLSPAFLRIAWMYYTDKQVRPLLLSCPPDASRSRFSNAPSAPCRPPIGPREDAAASSRSSNSPRRAPAFSFPRRRSCATSSTARTHAIASTSTSPAGARTRAKWWSTRPARPLAPPPTRTATPGVKADP